MSVIEKVEHLIALATADSANEFEAKNAALNALRLIKQHNLLQGAGRRDFARMSIEDIIEQGRNYEAWAGPRTPYQAPKPPDPDVDANERARRSWEEAKARKAARGVVDPDFANSTTLPNGAKGAFEPSQKGCVMQAPTVTLVSEFETSTWKKIVTTLVRDPRGKHTIVVSAHTRYNNGPWREGKSISFLPSEAVQASCGLDKAMDLLSRKGSDSQ